MLLKDELAKLLLLLCFEVNSLMDGVEVNCQCPLLMTMVCLKYLHQNENP